VSSTNRLTLIQSLKNDTQKIQLYLLNAFINWRDLTANIRTPHLIGAGHVHAAEQVQATCAVGADDWSRSSL